MKADIFIPTSNRLAALKACLTSLNHQTLSNFHIYLVGLCFDSKVELLVRKYKNLDIEYFVQHQPGIIGAANEALVRAKNDIFVRLDDDVVLDKDWYRNLLLTYKRFPRVGGVTGPTLMSEAGLKSRDLTTFLENFKKSNNPLLGLLNWVYQDYIYENKIFEVSRFLDSGAFTLGTNYSSCLKIKQLVDVDTLEACNWSCRTALLRQVGGFDTIYLKGLGDYHEADIPFKIRKIGFRTVFDPKVILKHNVEVGKVTKARPASYYRIQNFIIFYSRHIKFTSKRKILRFSCNLLLQNLYYVYRFLTTGNVSQLGAIPGTVVGIFHIYKKRLAR